MNSITTSKMSNFRWVICALLFIATTVNYMDRQVLSLTWKDFIAPEFHWTDDHYGTITGLFSIFYAIANLFAGKFVDWMGTKKGYLIAIFVWSTGAVMHAGWGVRLDRGAPIGTGREGCRRCHRHRQCMVVPLLPLDSRRG